MATMHIIKFYSGFDNEKECRYRTELDSRDYTDIDELLKEIKRELEDNEERLGELDDTDDDIR